MKYLLDGSIEKWKGGRRFHRLLPFHFSILPFFHSIKKFKVLFFFASIFFSENSFSQQYVSNNYGIMAGCVISGGTHVDQLGVFVKTFYTYNRFQWNNDVRINYYFKYLGPKIPHPEIQLSSGILVGYGRTIEETNVFWNKTSNQTKYRNSVGYAYNAYFNKIKTTQQTGTVTFQWNHFYLSTENDLLARPLLDRFRTAAIQFAYQKDNKRIALSHVMWTGRLGKPVRDSNYRSPAGYLDTTNAVYPFFSHGLLYVSGEFVEREFSQNLRASVGIDAEQIRHAVQNRFMHDGIFLPRKFRNPNNFHFPMISDQGTQYIFGKDQKVRKPKLYLNVFANPDVVY